MLSCLRQLQSQSIALANMQTRALGEASASPGLWLCGCHVDSFRLVDAKDSKAVGLAPISALRELAAAAQ